MPRYKTYWRWIPVRMIQEYKRIKKDPSSQAQLYVSAIEQAMKDTEDLPDGSLRLSAVWMVYIEHTHTANGAGIKLHVSKRTVDRYLGDFVNMVGKYVGF